MFMGKMRFGVYINNRAALYLPDLPTTKLLDFAREAEDLGFDSVWVGDSATAKPRLEPLIMLSSISAVTKKVKLGTSIFQPHLRNPVWTALSLASLDIISSGRLILGTGIGGGPKSDMALESKVFGIDPTQRGEQMAESVRLLKQLWTGPVTISKAPELLGLELQVKPIQKPHPPIWIAAGGHGTLGQRVNPDRLKFAYERVAALGDGWIIAPCDPLEYREAWSLIKERLLARKRPVDYFGKAMVAWTNVRESREDAITEGLEMIRRYYRVEFDKNIIDRTLLGTSEWVIKRLEMYASEGLEEVILVFHSKDPVYQMRQWTKEIKPSF